MECAPLDSAGQAVSIVADAAQQCPMSPQNFRRPNVNPSLTMSIAQYAASTRAERIPEKVRERAMHLIFDEMACAQFGRRSIAGELAARYATSLGGPAEASILGTSHRVPAPQAALANGTAGHGFEVDGAHIIGGHPGATIIQGALAVAERQHASGAEFLNAVVLGYDIGVRLIGACGTIFGVKNTYHLHADFMYGIGTAVAASRILGLDPVRHCHAMALSTFQANGLCALFAEDRHISKSFCHGQYALAGVSAALMAATGLEGNEDIIGAQHGLLEAWGIKDGPAILLRGLGEEYSVMGANFKFINAGYPIHAAVEAAMKLVHEHNLHADAIDAVQVGMPENAMRVVDNRNMHNICLQDMLSVALVRRGLKMSENYFPAILGDPAFLRMRPRVNLSVDPQLQAEQPIGRGARVTITTNDGKTFSNKVDAPRGHSSRGGVTWTDLGDKWRGELPGCDTDHVVRLAQRLEELDDVNLLTEAFAGKGS